MRLHNLETLAQEKEIYIDSYGVSSDNDHKGMGVYFKAHHLWYDFFEIVFFKYIDNKLKLKLGVYQLNKNNDNNFWVGYRNGNEFGYDLDSHIKLNEFYKINNDASIIVASHNTKLLYIIFIDYFDWYHYMNVRTYKYKLEGYYLRGEFALDYYNDFLMFTATVSKDGESYLSSYLLFFSYPNGTDFYMNISPYVKNSEYYNYQNLISYLISTRKIENNIFDYTPI